MSCPFKLGLQVVLVRLAKQLPPQHSSRRSWCVWFLCRLCCFRIIINIKSIYSRRNCVHNCTIAARSVNCFISVPGPEVGPGRSSDPPHATMICTLIMKSAFNLPQVKMESSFSFESLRYESGVCTVWV